MSIFNQICRLVLTLILAVLLVGFGVCGAYGAFGGLFGGLGGGFGGRDGYSMTFVVCGLAGLAIALLCGVALYFLWRGRPPVNQ